MDFFADRETEMQIKSDAMQTQWLLLRERLENH